MAGKAEVNEILVLGLGELGAAIVNAFLTHKSFSPQHTPLSVMIRPSTILTPTVEKATQLAEYESKGVKVIGGDLEAASLPELTALLAPFHTVIHAGAMTLKPGTQLKVTQAVLDTGTNKLYVPWQFGVDYDIITRSGGQGMFTEQLDVRDLLRSQSEVQWFIIACGVFMSFLFEDFWGVVVKEASGGNGTGKINKVRALGSWDDLLTATTAEDIATCTAEVVLADPGMRNKSVYIAGDSLKYSDFADVVEKTTGSTIERELWTTEQLRKDSEADPYDKLKKYQLVFSEGRGLAWPKDDTYNVRKGISMTTFEQYLRRKWMSR